MAPRYTARMNRTLRFACFALAAALLAACGNKGALVLPTPPPIDPATAPADAPVETAPAEAASTEGAPAEAAPAPGSNATTPPPAVAPTAARTHGDANG